MFFYLAKLAWFVLQPLAALLIVVGLALVAGWFGRRRMASALLMLAVAALAVSSLTPAGLLMTAVLEDRFPRPDLPERIDGIVVLGGAFDTRVARTRGVTELNDAADRVTAGMVLALRYPDAKLLFSGGVAAVVEEDIPETDAAEMFYAGLGLDRDRLLLDGRARDTFENAIFAKQLAQPRPGEVWLLVTSASHMPRAVGCFRTAGFPVIPYPVDYRTPSGAAVWRPSNSTIRNLEKVHFAIREYVGLVAYRLSGRTNALFPAP